MRSVGRCVFTNQKSSLNSKALPVSELCSCCFCSPMVSSESLYGLEKLSYTARVDCWRNCGERLDCRFCNISLLSIPGCSVRKVESDVETQDQPYSKFSARAVAATNKDGRSVSKDQTAPVQESVLDPRSLLEADQLMLHGNDFNASGEATSGNDMEGTILARQDKASQRYAIPAEKVTVCCLDEVPLIQNDVFEISVSKCGYNEGFPFDRMVGPRIDCCGGLLRHASHRQCITQKFDYSMILPRVCTFRSPASGMYRRGSRRVQRVWNRQKREWFFWSPEVGLGSCPQKVRV